MSFLLDTDICSRYLRRPSKLFHRFIQHAERLHLSAVGLSELYTWKDISGRLGRASDSANSRPL